MSKYIQNSVTYHFCAIVGWFMIGIGLPATFFLAIMAGDLTERAIRVCISFAVVILGVLIVRIVEKNIFKALDNVIHLM